jgi:hypothetical protein
MELVQIIGNDDFYTAQERVNEYLDKFTPFEITLLLNDAIHNPPRNLVIFDFLLFHGAQLDLSLLKLCQSRRVIEALIFDRTGSETLEQSIERFREYLPVFMFGF